MSIFKTLKVRAGSEQRKSTMAKARAIARKKAHARAKVYTTMFVTRRDLATSVELLTNEQRAQLREARARAEAMLAKPSMSPEALRARARRASEWEKSHNTITALAGLRR